MRIDKIRKNNKSNLIDLDISRFDLKFDNTNYNKDDKSWFITTKTCAANINLLKLIKNHDKQIQLIKEFKHFLKIQLLSVSESTTVCYFNIFIDFMVFVNNENIKINNFYDINYDVIHQYTDSLKLKKSAHRKYRDLKNLLTKISQTKNIICHEDIINKNFPQIKLNKNTIPIQHYTEDEFKSLSKTLVNIVEDFLSGDQEITESCFVMSSYWFISLCTGFNKTGLDSLSKDSFEYFDEHKNILTIIGEKNRSSKGYQFANITFNNESNNLLTRVINKLIDIKNSHLDNINSNSIFIHKAENSNSYYVYNGSYAGIQKSKTYKRYASKNKCIIAPSTAKIRNYRSLFLYDKSKNEKIVSDIMNHRSINTTIGHYIKQNLQTKDYLGLLLVQNLLTSFANNTSFNDWVLFQNHFDLKNTDQNIIVKNINNGVYNSPLGSCIKDLSKEPCTNYINCFKCKHYSVIGERDLWKILSFRECLNEFLTERLNSDYKWLIESINSILSNFNREQILTAKKQLKTIKNK